MTITHQDIADRLGQTYSEEATARSKASEAFQAERKSLQELCGGIGHIKRGGMCIVCRHGSDGSMAALFGLAGVGAASVVQGRAPTPPAPEAAEAGEA